MNVQDKLKACQAIGVDAEIYSREFSSTGTKAQVFLVYKGTRTAIRDESLFMSAHNWLIKHVENLEIGYEYPDTQGRIEIAAWLDNEQFIFYSSAYLDVILQTVIGIADVILKDDNENLADED